MNMEKENLVEIYQGENGRFNFRIIKIGKYE